jgi:hypothetical protein
MTARLVQAFEEQFTLGQCIRVLGKFGGFASALNNVKHNFALNFAGLIFVQPGAPTVEQMHCVEVFRKSVAAVSHLDTLPSRMLIC